MCVINPLGLSVLRDVCGVLFCTLKLLYTPIDAPNKKKLINKKEFFYFILSLLT